MILETHRNRPSSRPILRKQYRPRKSPAPSAVEVERSNAPVAVEVECLKEHVSTVVEMEMFTEMVLVSLTPM